jgi:chitinase
MKRRMDTCLLFVLAALGFLSSMAAAQSKRFVGYYTEWSVYGHDFVPADIPADRLTHLNYAFLQPADTDGDGLYECTIADPYAAYQKDMVRVVPGTDVGEGDNYGALVQLRLLRYYRLSSSNQYMPLIFSIGGAGSGGVFGTIAASSTHRQHFVQSCIQLLQREIFDGFDVDWETPASAQTASYTALLQDFRTALTGLGNNPRTDTPYLLTAAVPAASWDIDAISVPAIAPLVDWVNVMVYDFHGCWGDDHTGHNSPLFGSSQDPHAGFSADAAIHQWLTRGMPAAKINLGLAYYGRAFKELLSAGPNPSYPGRYAPLDPARNAPPNCVTGSFNSTDGTFDYWDLAQRFVNVNGYTRYWDGEQDVPFLYNPANSASYWISYDDATSIANKAAYARNQNLGGVFAWELSLESSPQTPKTYPLTSAAAGALNP